MNIAHLSILIEFVGCHVIYGEDDFDVVLLCFLYDLSYLL